MWWMKAKNNATLASTSRKATVTESWGTKGSSPPRTSRSTMRANTKDDVKTPRVTWVIRLLRKLPSRRGVNWLLASCMTTMVIEKTSPVTEIMALAMVLSRLRADSAPPPKRYGRSSVSAASMRGSNRPAATARAQIIDGSTQKGPQSRSHQPIVSGSPTGPTVRRTVPELAFSSVVTCSILPPEPARTAGAGPPTGNAPDSGTH